MILLVGAGCARNNACMLFGDNSQPLPYAAMRRQKVKVFLCSTKFWTGIVYGLCAGRHLSNKGGVDYSLELFFGIYTLVLMCSCL